MPDTMEAPTQTNELSLIAQRSGLAPAVAESLVVALTPLVEQAAVLINEAAGVVVTDPTQVTEIKRSRELRLALKRVRVEVEHARKDLKEESLKRGQAIDSVARFVNSKIEPVENRLEQQEKIAERLEAERKAALRRARETELAPYTTTDCRFLDLANMPEDQYQNVLAGAKRTHEEHLARAERERKEREEADKARAAEEARLREENARLAREKAEAYAAAVAEREAAEEKARAERERLRAIADQERAAREKLEAEAAAARKAEEDRKTQEAAAARKAALAPDKQKVGEFAASLRAIAVPGCNADEAKTLMAKAGAHLGKLADWLESEAESL